MKQRGLKLHHLYAPALLGQEVMFLNTLIGGSESRLCKINFADVLGAARVDQSLTFSCRIVWIQGLDLWRCVRVRFATAVSIFYTMWFSLVIFHLQFLCGSAAAAACVE